MLDALRARLGERVRFARGCDVEQRARATASTEAVALAARGRRRDPGDGRQGRADRRLHERRDPRPRVARPPGRAGGARPRRRRDGHAGRARARRRPALRRRVRCTSIARPSCSPGSPARRAPSAIADALLGAFNPGGKLPISYPRSSGQLPVFYGHKVSGGRSHWKVRLRRRAGGAALPVRARPLLHELRARVGVRPPHRGVLARDGDRRRHRPQHAALARATKSSSSTSATRSRA